MKQAVARIIIVSMVFAIATIASAAPKQRRHKVTVAPAPAVPKLYNRFVTVHEFQVSGRSVGTLVSVEGYFVTGYRAPSGALLLSLTDSVDHVFNTADAKTFERHGALMTVRSRNVPASGPRAWNRKGIMQYVMYTGKDTPVTLLHDVVEKVRVTGLVGPISGAVYPVTLIEYTDQNGFWKKL
jgi:hypothetical protein